MNSRQRLRVYFSAVLFVTYVKRKPFNLEMKFPLYPGIYEETFLHSGESTLESTNSFNINLESFSNVWKSKIKSDKINNHVAGSQGLGFHPPVKIHKLKPSSERAINKRLNDETLQAFPLNKRRYSLGIKSSPDEGCEKSKFNKYYSQDSLGMIREEEVIGEKRTIGLALNPLEKEKNDSIQKQNYWNVGDTSKKNFNGKNAEDDYSFDSDSDNPADKAENENGRLRFDPNFGGAKFVLYPDDPIKVKWDTILSVILVYISIIVPYRLFFMNDDGDLGWEVLDRITDSIFGLDILVSFFSVYYNKDEEPETNLKKIAKKYLSSWFFIDFLSVIPIDFILATSRFNTLARLTKLPRLLKVIRMIKMIRIFKIYKQRNSIVSQLFGGFVAARRLIIALASGFFFCHLAACLWFVTADLNEERENWVTHYGYTDLSEFELYIKSFYWVTTTVVTVGYGDIVAQNSYEQLISCLLMLVGVLFYSFTIGSLSSILSEWDRQRADLDLHLETLLKIKKQYKISNSLSMRIKRALRYNLKVGLREKGELLKELPQNLRIDISYIMHRDAVKGIRFFKDRSPRFIALIGPHLKKVHFGPNEYIYMDTDLNNEMYFIKTGEVTIVLREYKDFPFMIIAQGYYFGEVDMLFTETKKFTYKTGEAPCELLSISKREFTKIFFHEFREIGGELYKNALKRKVRQIKFHKEALNYCKKVFVSSPDFKISKKLTLNSDSKQKKNSISHLQKNMFTSQISFGYLSPTAKKNMTNEDVNELEQLEELTKRLDQEELEENQHSQAFKDFENLISKSEPLEQENLTTENHELNNSCHRSFGGAKNATLTELQDENFINPKPSNVLEKSEGTLVITSNEAENPNETESQINQNVSTNNQKQKNKRNLRLSTQFERGKMSLFGDYLSTNLNIPNLASPDDFGVPFNYEIKSASLPSNHQKKKKSLGNEKMRSIFKKLSGVKGFLSDQIEGLIGAPKRGSSNQNVDNKMSQIEFRMNNLENNMFEMHKILNEMDNKPLSLSPSPRALSIRSLKDAKSPKIKLSVNLISLPTKKSPSHSLKKISISRLMSSQTCTIHHEEKMNWLCLELNCEKRLLCSKCAVKNHDKSHHVEELESIKEKGLLSFFNVDSFIFEEEFNSPKDLPSNSADFCEEIDYLVSMVGSNLRRSLNLHSQALVQITEALEAPSERKTALNQIEEIEKDIKKNYKSTDLMRDKLDEAITLIHLNLLKTGNDTIENRTELLRRKKELLSMIKNKFVNLVRSFFENSFTTNFCSLFEIQLQTLLSKVDMKVKVEKEFVSYLEDKWKLDYRVLNQTLQNCLNKLSMDLNTILFESPQGFMGINPGMPQDYFISPPVFSHPMQLKQQEIPVFYPPLQPHTGTGHPNTFIKKEQFYYDPMINGQKEQGAAQFRQVPAPTHFSHEKIEFPSSNNSEDKNPYCSDFLGMCQGAQVQMKKYPMMKKVPTVGRRASNHFQEPIEGAYDVYNRGNELNLDCLGSPGDALIGNSSDYITPKKERDERMHALSEKKNYVKMAAPSPHVAFGSHKKYVFSDNRLNSGY